MSDKPSATPRLSRAEMIALLDSLAADDGVLVQHAAHVHLSVDFIQPLIEMLRSSAGMPAEPMVPTGECREIQLGGSSAQSSERRTEDGGKWISDKEHWSAPSARPAAGFAFDDWMDTTYTGDWNHGKFSVDDMTNAFHAGMKSLRSAKEGKSK